MQSSPSNFPEGMITLSSELRSVGTLDSILYNSLSNQSEQQSGNPIVKYWKIQHIFKKYRQFSVTRNRYKVAQHFFPGIGVFLLLKAFFVIVFKTIDDCETKQNS